MSFKKYFKFNRKGRATRKEFWLYILFNILMLLALVAIDITVGTFISMPWMGFISALYMLIMSPAFFGFITRRLHDINYNGAWCLLFFAPIIGIAILIFVNDWPILVSIIPLTAPLVLLYLLIKPSATTKNKFNQAIAETNSSPVVKPPHSIAIKKSSLEPLLVRVRSLFMRLWSTMCRLHSSALFINLASKIKKLSLKSCFVRICSLFAQSRASLYSIYTSELRVNLVSQIKELSLAPLLAQIRSLFEPLLSGLYNLYRSEFSVKLVSQIKFLSQDSFNWLKRTLLSRLQ